MFVANFHVQTIEPKVTRCGRKLGAANYPSKNFYFGSPNLRNKYNFVNGPITKAHYKEKKSGGFSTHQSPHNMCYPVLKKG
jgi:hypothetical protein